MSGSTIENTLRSSSGRHGEVQGNSLSDANVERPNKFEVPTKNHCLKAGGSVEICFVENCFPKIRWTDWQIRRRVNTGYIPEKYPRFHIESFEKRPFFQKHVNLHFVTVRLVLVYVGESLLFRLGPRIWNAMEIQRTLTSCRMVFFFLSDVTGDGTWAVTQQQRKPKLYYTGFILKSYSPTWESLKPNQTNECR